MTQQKPQTLNSKKLDRPAVIQDLYQKVAEFESKQSANTRALSNCKKGCSQCCYVDLSIFEIEAQNICDWFTNLLPTQQTTLIKKWTEPQKQNACAFLNKEECTIYEARPLICRTQGLALQFREHQQNFIDICPLNEKILEKITENEILNLDLLNQILVQIESAESKGTSRERIRLIELRSSLMRASGPGSKVSK